MRGPQDATVLADDLYTTAMATVATLQPRAANDRHDEPLVATAQQSVRRSRRRVEAWGSCGAQTPIDGCVGSGHARLGRRGSYGRTLRQRSTIAMMNR